MALSENAIQRAIFDHLRTRAHPRTFAFHVKNSSSDMRGRRRGIYAGLGLVPGVPDVVIIHAGAVYGLELKTEKGKVSPAQDEAMAWMTHAGATCAVAHGLDAAIAQLEIWGILKGVAA